MVITINPTMKIERVVDEVDYEVDLFGVKMSFKKARKTIDALLEECEPRCCNCGVALGYSNPRQLCAKTCCLYEAPEEDNGLSELQRKEIRALAYKRGKRASRKMPF